MALPFTSVHPKTIDGGIAASAGIRLATVSKRPEHTGVVVSSD